MGWFHHPVKGRPLVDIKDLQPYLKYSGCFGQAVFKGSGCGGGCESGWERGCCGCALDRCLCIVSACATVSSFTTCKARSCRGGEGRAGCCGWQRCCFGCRWSRATFHCYLEHNAVLSVWSCCLFKVWHSKSLQRVPCLWPVGGGDTEL